MRHILHVDMNAFFASCHQAENPAWRGKPLLVAGDPKKRHGIVLTASYEARKYGVKTAIPVWQAKKLCPHGIFVPPDHSLYLSYAEKILEIMRTYTPLVEPFSIDEAWLDVTGSVRLFGPAPEIGRMLQQQILREVKIPCSVGLAPNKFLAKMASERQKPNGFTVIMPADVKKVLWPLPVEEMVGVGRKLAPALKEMGVETIGQLASMPKHLLTARFGVMGEILRNLANGEDDSPVDPHALDTVKSIGHSVTLPRDLCNPEDIARVLLDLSERVGRRLRHGGYSARTVTLTVKDQNFVSTTRSRTLPEPTILTETIYETALSIYRTHYEPWRKVRLLGVSVSNLQERGEGRQLALWSGNEEKLARLTEAADALRDRFGDYILRRASLYSDENTD
ncbi:MAG TPA: DNA polymerase IV [Firmicutes bacterium]|nr:DNA polymerase IV [Bacillota bacterium]